MPKQTFFSLPAAKREQIMAVALDEFGRNPYTRVSVGTIARRAGIAKGSIYQYFEDKQDLYMFLLHQAGEVKLEFLKRHELNREDFYSGLVSLILAGTEFELEYPRHARLGYFMLTSPFRDETLTELQQVGQGHLAELVSMARVRGEIRADIPTDLIAYFCSALMMGFGDFIAGRLGLTWEELYKPGALTGLRDVREQLKTATMELVELMRRGMAPTSP